MYACSCRSRCAALQLHSCCCARLALLLLLLGRYNRVLHRITLGWAMFGCVNGIVVSRIIIFLDLLQDWMRSRCDTPIQTRASRPSGRCRSSHTNTCLHARARARAHTHTHTRTPLSTPHHVPPVRYSVFERLGTHTMQKNTISLLIRCTHHQ